jgi:hypothetical protein
MELLCNIADLEEEKELSGTGENRSQMVRMMKLWFCNDDDANICFVLERRKKVDQYDEDFGLARDIYSALTIHFN